MASMPSTRRQDRRRQRSNSSSTTSSRSSESGWRKAENRLRHRGKRAEAITARPVALDDSAMGRAKMAGQNDRTGVGRIGKDARPRRPGQILILAIFAVDLRQMDLDRLVHDIGDKHGLLSA